MRIAYLIPRMVSVAVAALSVLTGCRPADTDSSPSKIAVDVVIATPSTLADVSRLTGRSDPYRSAQVRARVAGIVQKREYTEGAEVKEGELLFHIDPSQLIVNLSAAQAELTQARVTADAARDIAQRSMQLVEDHSISTQQYRKDFFAEKHALAVLQVAQAKVRDATLQLSYASVTSPISGRARRALVSEGALVGQDEGTVLTTVEQIDPIYVNFSLPVADFLELRKAQFERPDDGSLKTVRLLLGDGTRYEVPGTLEFSDSAVDPHTDTVALRAVFSNSNHLLLPGMYMQVEVTRASAGKVILIPQQALSRGAGGAYVMVENNGVAHQVSVHADSLERNQWRVESGLLGGEKVILEGGALRDGQPIELKKSSAPANVNRS